MNNINKYLKVLIFNNSIQYCINSKIESAKWRFQESLQMTGTTSRTIKNLKLRQSNETSKGIGFPHKCQLVFGAIDVEEKENVNFECFEGRRRALTLIA